MGLINKIDVHLIVYRLEVAYGRGPDFTEVFIVNAKRLIYNYSFLDCAEYKWMKHPREYRHGGDI